MNNAFPYLRVSTDEQAKSGVGLKAQEAACISFCETRGFNIVRPVFLDCKRKSLLENPDNAEFQHNPYPGDREIKGDTRFEDRPGLRSIMEKIGKGDVIVTFSLDRISRDENLLPALRYQLMPKKASILSTLDEGTWSDDEGSFYYRAGTAMRSYGEKQMARLRAKSDFTAYKSRSLRFGSVPWGFMLEPGSRLKLIPNPAEEAVTLMAHELRARGLSLGAIVSELERRGFAPRGAKWHKAQIHKLLTLSCG